MEDMCTILPNTCSFHTDIGRTMSVALSGFSAAAIALGWVGARVEQRLVAGGRRPSAGTHGLASRLSVLDRRHLVASPRTPAGTRTPSATIEPRA
jgi:hypothetical protein